MPLTDPNLATAIQVLAALVVIAGAKCGRRVGGLGSVQTTNGKNTWRGLGPQGWKPDSPHEQSIVLDPENVSITSDNATTLINLYKKLEFLTACERDRKMFFKLQKRPGIFPGPSTLCQMSSRYRLAGLAILLNSLSSFKKRWPKEPFRPN